MSIKQYNCLDFGPTYSQLLHDDFYEKWLNHYDRDLLTMYRILNKKIGINRIIPYESFCEWVYSTSAKRYNNKYNITVPIIR